MLKNIPRKVSANLTKCKMYPSSQQILQQYIQIPKITKKGIQKRKQTMQETLLLCFSMLKEPQKIRRLRKKHSTKTRKGSTLLSPVMKKTHSHVSAQSSPKAKINHHTWELWSKNKTRTVHLMDSITEWEDIPGIDKVIEHAKRNSADASKAGRKLSWEVLT